MVIYIRTIPALTHTKNSASRNGTAMAALTVHKIAMVKGVRKFVFGVHSLQTLAANSPVDYANTHEMSAH